jgi:ferric-dicitrate binding protein FerR (iron transport regulator)
MRAARLAAALVWLLAAAAWVSALEGTLAYADGDVYVRHGGVESDASIGMSLGQGDVVRTGEDSVAVIDLGGEAEIKLRAATTLSLDSLSESVAVSLTRGGAFSKVTRRTIRDYTLKASTAVAGVRGTEFFVAYGRTIDALPDVWLCVAQGTVRVSLEGSPDTVLVEQGKGINIVGGSKLTRPRSYPWTRKLNWSMDARSGPVRDRTNLDRAYSDLLDQDYD